MIVNGLFSWCVERQNMCIKNAVAGIFRGTKWNEKKTKCGFTFVDNRASRKLLLVRCFFIIFFRCFVLTFCVKKLFKLIFPWRNQVGASETRRAALSYSMVHVYIKVPVSHSAVAVLPFLSAIGSLSGIENCSLKGRDSLRLHRDTPRLCATSIRCVHFQQNFLFLFVSSAVLMMMIVWQYTKQMNEKKKTFNAMMSHSLIQAFAEHEKIFPQNAKKVLLLCL